MNKPTIAAIDTAIRNGQKMHGMYTVEAVAGLPGRYYVQHKEQPRRCYIVDMREGRERCQCPQFDMAASCKHQFFCFDWLRMEEAEEIEQAKVDAGIR